MWARDLRVGAGPSLLRAWRGHCAEVQPSLRGECELTVSESFQATPLSSLLRSCALTTSPRSRLFGVPSEQGFLMAWQVVSRKGGGKGWNQGVQDQLLQSMTAMQNSISQLAHSMNTRPPLGSKGQGKGKPPKGQGKGVKSSPGEHKNPNLKPTEERA